MGRLFQGIHEHWHQMDHLSAEIDPRWPQTAHLSVGVGQLWHLMALLLEAADQLYVPTDHTSVVVAAFYNLMDHLQVDEYLIAAIKVN